MVNLPLLVIFLGFLLLLAVSYIYMESQEEGWILATSYQDIE